MNDNKLVLQNNKAVFGRYDYSAIEKNIYLRIIQCLQNNLKQETVFGDVVVQFPITKFKSHYNHIQQGLDNILVKKISFNNKELVGSCTLISEWQLHKKTRIIEIHIRSTVIELLKHSMKNFTAIDVIVALTLKSNYSKRIYEMINSWKNKGCFFLTIEEFKKMLCLEEKYKDISMLRKKTLDVAKKEMDETERCDVSFNYTFEKEKVNGKLIYNKIHFKIYNKYPAEKTGDEKLKLHLNLMSSFNILNQNYDTIKLITHLQDLNIGEKALNTAEKIREKYKTNENIIPVIITALKQDFNINLDDFKNKKNKLN